MSDRTGNIILILYALGVVAVFGLAVAYPIIAAWKRRRRAREAERRGFMPVMRRRG